MVIAFLDSNKNTITTFPIIAFEVKEKIIEEYSKRILGHTQPCMLEREMLRREAIYDFVKNNCCKIFKKDETIFDFSNYNIEFAYVQILNK